MVPSSEPLSIRAGDTAQWTKSATDYPASAGWQLSYSIRNSLEKYSLDFGTEITADGADFAVTVPATKTASWKAGTYIFYGYVLKAGERHTVASGEIQILDNPAKVEKFDPRSFNRRMLDAINASILGTSTSDVQSYAINGRQLTKMTKEELHKWQQTYAWRVAREQGTAPEFYGARFGRPY